ncbi:MAG: hypothetical protein M9963_05575 [Kiritimatiellae bacterium]|nr:hypothetical protein [Kiritimatiellia bacterium]
MRAQMLISREKNRFKEIDAAKTSLGQFQTRHPGWLAPHVLDFIRHRAPAILYDPFAGRGELLRMAQREYPAELRGLDIDPTTHWPANDSLRHIPPLNRAVIVTNPPYLAKHSAKRKGVYSSVASHFASRRDLYQVALDRCSAACAHIVAIVPETLINSDYPKTHMEHITILEANPFTDTDCPVCVVCMDTTRAAIPEGPMIYLGAQPIATLAALNSARLHPQNTVAIHFNEPTGRIALRAVDLPDPLKPIAFMRRAELDYPPDRVRTSSRLVTFIEIPNLPDTELDALVTTANRRLAELRRATADIILSPFKGNTQRGTRRRRLDYYTARAILECSLNSLEIE